MKPVTEVAQIADPMERLTAAADLVREAEAKVESLRPTRDLAILVMLRPFADAVAATNAERARLRDRLNKGKITDEKYAAALAKNREKRRADLEAADVTVYPKDVYEMLDVSRNLVNRLLMRMPAAPLPDLPDAATVAREAHAQIPDVERIIAEAREIRDTAALILMSGEDEAGNTFRPVSNADVARATGLTTARIAQLREGVR